MNLTGKLTGTPGTLTTILFVVGSTGAVCNIALISIAVVPQPMQPELKTIISQLKDIQNGKLWMGANFSSRLEKITDKEAFIQPVKNMHSVAELLSHLTAWRKDAILKIRTGAGKLTENQKENWPPAEELVQLGWAKVKSDYEQSLHELLNVLETKDDSFLEETYHDTDYKSEYTYRFLVQGLLHHDIYHLGQLGITIKYLNTRAKEN